MNRTNAHLYLPLVQALADGKQLQFHTAIYGQTDNYRWDVIVGDVKFGLPPEKYRIKPFEIEVGKFYKTRYGTKAYVAAIVPTPLKSYQRPFIGWYGNSYNQNEGGHWFADGRFSDVQKVSNDQPYDLVELWQD